MTATIVIVSIAEIGDAYAERPFRYGPFLYRGGLAFAALLIFIGLIQIAYSPVRSDRFSGILGGVFIGVGLILAGCVLVCLVSTADAQPLP